MDIYEQTFDTILEKRKNVSVMTTNFQYMIAYDTKLLAYRQVQKVVTATPYYRIKIRFKYSLVISEFDVRDESRYYEMLMKRICTKDNL